MTVLERNLEQLTTVQRQLVQQNASLKKEFAISERKLIARNERIQNMEMLLQDAQTKIQLQSQTFDAQLSAMRSQLQKGKNTHPLFLVQY
jgi:kinesin family protein 5